MGGFRRFTRVFEVSSNRTVAQTGDNLQSIEIMLQSIEQKLALLEKEEKDHNISLEALANNLFVSTPKTIRSNTRE